MKYFLIAFAIFTVSCSGLSDTNTTYNRDEVGSVSNITYGIIVSMEEVAVKGKNSGTGTVLGAGMGGVLGSMLGKGSRANIAGAIAGGVVGGIAGSESEKKITAGKSVRFIIEKDNGATVSIIQSNERGFKIGDNVMIMSGSETHIEYDNRH